jgi:hypothetical protein
MANDLQQRGIALHNYQDANQQLLNEAERQVQEELAQQGEDRFDNRGRLNYFFEQQDVQRSKNVVSDLGSNFDMDGVTAGGNRGGEALNPDFLLQNSLETKSALKSGETARTDAPAAETEGKLQGRYLRGGKPSADDAVQEGQQQSGQKVPAIADKRELDELSKKLDAAKESDEAKDRAGAERSEQLERYQQNLERNSLELGFRQMDAYGVQPGGTQSLNGQPAMGGYGGMLQQSGTELAAPGYDALANAPAGGPAAANPMAKPGQPGDVQIDDSETISQVAAGLASLDVRLPERGRLYSFTTPRGDVEITARSVPQKLWNKLIGLVALLAAILIVGLLSRPSARRLWSGLFDSTSFGIVVAVIGFFSLVLGILPLAGMLLIATGLGLAIRSRLAHHALAHQPEA